MPEPYWIFWGALSVIGVGFCSLWTVLLLECRDLLRDIVRSGSPFR